MVQHNRTVVAVKIDFKEVLRDWESPLNTRVLQSEYMQKLLLVTHKDYKRTVVRPDKVDIFRAFRLTSFKDTRVVIVGQDPYPSKKATGLAFGNDYDRSGPSLAPSLEMIRQCVEKTCYDGLHLDFDPSLVTWGKQGVLLLNSSLTVEDGKIGTHYARWRKFMRIIIQTLNEEKTGICFLFLGAQAKMLMPYVDKKRNYVFDYVHPAYAARNNTEWNCPYFSKINEIIEEQNGKEFCIKW